MRTPSIGMSTFARQNHAPGKGKSYTTLGIGDLISLVELGWRNRKPGMGETTLARKVVVPIRAESCESFYCASALITEGMEITARAARRPGQDQEDLHVETLVRTDDIHSRGYKVEQAKHVGIVCYSAAALMENGGTRSSFAEWEIVAILASPVEQEPMHPLTMARNMLGKPGGTLSTYTAEQFAEAVYYWSQRVKVIDPLVKHE